MQYVCFDRFLFSNAIYFDTYIVIDDKLYYNSICITYKIKDFMDISRKKTRSYMTEAINWIDDYFVSKDRVVLTNHEIKVPGIRLLAMHRIQNAIIPLLPHYHENAFEFVLVVNGSLSFYTNNQEYIIPGGNVFVTFPDEIHSTNDVPISLTHFYWIQIDISDPDHFLFLKKDVAQELIQNLLELKNHVITAENKELARAIEKAFQLCRAAGSRLQIAGYVLIFLELLLATPNQDSRRKSSDIERAVDYIETHITEELALEELASLSNLSTSQFKQKFRHVVGVSPRNYINEKKVARSKELLRQGCSVTDTAMALSFNSSSYFSTVFKKYTLKTPRQYIFESRTPPP